MIGMMTLFRLGISFSLFGQRFPVQRRRRRAPATQAKRAPPASRGHLKSTPPSGIPWEFKKIPRFHLKIDFFQTDLDFIYFTGFSILNLVSFSFDYFLYKYLWIKLSSKYFSTTNSKRLLRQPIRQFYSQNNNLLNNSTYTKRNN